MPVTPLLGWHEQALRLEKGLAPVSVGQAEHLPDTK